MIIVADARFMNIYSIATSQNYSTSILLELFLFVHFPVLSLNNTRSWLYIIFEVDLNIRVASCRGNFPKRRFDQGEKKREYRYLIQLKRWS